MYRCHAKDKFIEDLRKVREGAATPEEIRDKLACMRSRLDDPELLSPECVLNMMLAYRQIQVFSSYFLYAFLSSKFILNLLKKRMLQKLVPVYLLFFFSS